MSNHTLVGDIKHGGSILTPFEKSQFLKEQQALMIKYNIQKLDLALVPVAPNRLTPKDDNVEIAHA